MLMTCELFSILSFHCSDLLEPWSRSICIYIHISGHQSIWNLNLGTWLGNTLQSLTWRGPVGDGVRQSWEALAPPLLWLYHQACSRNYRRRTGWNDCSVLCLESIHPSSCKSKVDFLWETRFICTYVICLRWTWFEACTNRTFCSVLWREIDSEMAWRCNVVFMGMGKSKDNAGRQLLATVQPPRGTWE